MKVRARSREPCGSYQRASRFCGYSRLFEEGSETTDLRLRILSVLMSMKSISQCWFCAQINLVEIEEPEPRCMRCGLVEASRRPETSAGSLPVAPPENWFVNIEEAPAPEPVVPVPPPPPVVVESQSDESACEEVDDDATRIARMVEDIDDDATRIAPRPSRSVWAITTEHGDFAPLVADDVIVGRKPVASDDATPVTIPDPEKTLSKTHARLRRDPVGDTWTIEDLGSTNGTTLLDESLTEQTTLLPGDATPATPYLLLGDMRVTLQRHDTRQDNDASLLLAQI